MILTLSQIYRILTLAERKRAFALLALMVIGMILEMLGIGLVIPAIALLMQQNITSDYPTIQPIFQALGNPTQMQLITGGALTLVVVYLIRTLFLAFLSWRQASFAFGVQAQLSQRLFTIYLRQPYLFHLQHNSAQLIRNVLNEVNGFTFNGILPSIILLTELLVSLGLSSLLFVIEPIGTLIVMGVLSIAAWGFHRGTRGGLKRWGVARQDHEGLRIQHLQQGLGGVKDVKLLGCETEFLTQYSVHNLQSARMGKFQQTLQQLPRLWLELLAVSGLALLVIIILKQGRPLEAILPTLGLFTASAFRLMPSITRTMSAVQSLRYGQPIFDLLSTELNLTIPNIITTKNSRTPMNSTLELDQITYSYPNTSEPTLKNISLSIKRGESIGFIGASGAGKSTLVDILLGLLTPENGEVRVDGKNIQTNLSNWQTQIGYVPQSIFFTDDTLRRNVAFGLANEQINDAAVKLALQAAQLEDFVASLPDGLETIVGERGVRLSGGQRQRIGIARALYHDPELLVLDEATSALDTITERDVMNGIAKLQGRKTILIVSHRLSTVEHCNKLYRLHNGQLVEEGTPKTIIFTQPLEARA